MHVSKRIRRSEAAYDRLAAHKREDETVSKGVRRLAGERSLTDRARASITATARQEAATQERDGNDED